MSRRMDLAWRLPALAAVVVDGASVALYLVVIDARGDEPVTSRATLTWAVAMAAPGLLCGIAAVLPPRAARWVLPVAILPAGVIGLLAIFSVGLLFLLVAFLAGAAALLSWTLTLTAARPGSSAETTYSQS